MTIDSVDPEQRRAFLEAAATLRRISSGNLAVRQALRLVSQVALLEMSRTRCDDL